jgi:hypothetical protein
LSRIRAILLLLKTARGKRQVADANAVQLQKDNDQRGISFQGAGVARLRMTPVWA